MAEVSVLSERKPESGAVAEERNAEDPLAAVKNKNISVHTAGPCRSKRDGYDARTVGRKSRVGAIL
jgi:hypothetical protein